MTEEQVQYKEMARKFAREVIAPQAAHFDRTGEVISNCSRQTAMVCVASDGYVVVSMGHPQTSI